MSGQFNDTAYQFWFIIELFAMFVVPVVVSLLLVDLFGNGPIAVGRPRAALK